MGRRTWIVVLLCVGFLGTVGVVGAVTAATPGADGATLSAGESGLQDDGEYESLQIRLSVQADGDVVWTYRYIYPVESAEERDAFEDYAERFEEEETRLYREFLEQSEALTASAAERLGREMTATDYERSAGVDATPTRNVGEVELTYRWTNFAPVHDGAVHVGDVFEGGFYLAEGQSLVIVADDGLAFETFAPDEGAATAPLGDRETVTWSGEHRFADGHPRAVLAPEDELAGGQNGGDTNDADSIGWTSLLALGGGILLLVAVLVVVAHARDDLPALGGSEASAIGAGDGGGGSSPGTAPAAVGSTSEETIAPAKEAVVSDEERVTELLAEHGGRMKQTEIVGETEWSKSKVSMLLSEMDDDDTITKIQVGRENIIALRGNEPEAANSPFDDSE